MDGSDGYFAGERRVHRIRERDLFFLVQAAKTLLDPEVERRLGRMEPGARFELLRATRHAEESIAERELYG